MRKSNMRKPKRQPLSNAVAAMQQANLRLSCYGRVADLLSGVVRTVSDDERTTALQDVLNLVSAAVASAAALGASEGQMFQALTAGQKAGGEDREKRAEAFFAWLHSRPDPSVALMVRLAQNESGLAAA
jgi:hypothetical protein